MRIIAGSARSRVIQAPKGKDTRPTQDRVREALFSILQESIAEAQVLDLFAGSGALALESLSRGAAFAVMADISREANRVQRLNAEALGFSEKTAIYLTDWKAAIDRCAGEGFRFDIVFMDPPYRMQDLTAVGEKLARDAVLAQEALVVIEHDDKHPPVFSSQFHCVDQRRYGISGLSFYRLTHDRGSV